MGDPLALASAGETEAGMRPGCPKETEREQVCCNVLPASADVTKQTVCPEQLIHLSELLTGRVRPCKQQHVLSRKSPGWASFHQMGCQSMC